MVNHKKVQRLMKALGLSARIRRKRKYYSYQGEVGMKAENLIQRQFEASKPMEKCYTDVTGFAIPASTQKLYLSPVLDGFNSEIIAYNLSTSPNLKQAIVDHIDYYNNKRIKIKLKLSSQGHITKRGNPYTRNILFKCIHNIASASHTNPCHIADFYEKRKRQSQVTSTKPHTIASTHRLIRTMYYLITHNKLYDYTSTQNR